MTVKMGTVALIGRPNAGKSTLMNRLLVEKLAIVSDKPQTTRQRLVGILTEARGQMVFFDTPGMHKPLHRLNQEMMRHAMSALDEADLCCLLVDASTRFGAGDQFLLERIRQLEVPRFLALNKIDLIDRPALLPIIERYAASGAFEEIVPLSALSGDGCDRILTELWNRLPVGEPRYDAELYTVHPERFLVAERIREKLLERTREELPFTSAVVVERWEEDPDRPLLRIWATILVERQSQKKIVVGRGGRMIKSLGTAARLDLEEFLGRRIYLDLLVRHEPGWRESQRILRKLDRQLLTDSSSNAIRLAEDSPPSD